jgi:hypothetical protein
MGGYFAANNSVYLGFNATIPFQMASSSDDNAPINGTQNAPFGFNTALLSNISAVMLDVPEPDYLASIQQNISGSESWYISATVNGTVATMNMSTEYRTNDTLWEEAFKHTVDGLWSWSLCDGFDLGVLVGNNPADPGPYCFAGYYVGSSGSEADFGVNSTDVQKFRNSAFMINLNRQRCAGEWLVTPSRVSLISASCTGELTNQTVFATSVPFQLDAMPVMVHSLSTYSPSQPRKASDWRLPSFTINTAAMFWSRMIWMNGYLTKDYATNSEIYYPPKNETIIFQRQTMKEH